MAGYSGYFVYVGGQLLSQTCRTPLLSSEGKTFWETQSVNLDSWTWPWLVLLQREGFPSAWFGISDLSREVWCEQAVAETTSPFFIFQEFMKT